MTKWTTTDGAHTIIVDAEIVPVTDRAGRPVADAVRVAVVACIDGRRACIDARIDDLTPALRAVWAAHGIVARLMGVGAPGAGIGLTADRLAAIRADIATAAADPRVVAHREAVRRGREIEAREDVREQRVYRAMV